MSNGAFMYEGTPVVVARTADISNSYRPGGKLSYVVQQVLDQLKPWDDHDLPAFTAHISRRVYHQVVGVVKPEDVFWAVHRGHKAKQPGLSPFIRPSGAPQTSYFTVEMAGTPSSPLLVRAYPGAYMPPLPWMHHTMSSKSYACEFWSRHAYVYHEALVRGSIVNDPPSWYQPE